MKTPTSTLTIEEKNYFMREAIKEAEKAGQQQEVPIGAVVVIDGKIVGRGHNLRETTKQAASHAEMYAIEEACKNVANWRLETAQLFVTLEPCPMCSGAMLLARVDEVYFGAYDPKAGSAGSLLNLLEDERFNHWAYVEGGVLGTECGQLLTQFFKELRARKKMAKSSQKD